MNRPTTDTRITDALPHRPPMLLIDAVREREGERIVCEKTFLPDEFFFQGHFPGSPVVPGVILCECAAQSAAVLLFELAAGDNQGLPLLTRLRDARFKQMVLPHDTVSIEARLEEQAGNAYQLSARIRKQGKLAASVNLVCAIQETA